MNNVRSQLLNLPQLQDHINQIADDLSVYKTKNIRVS